MKMRLHFLGTLLVAALSVLPLMAEGEEGMDLSEVRGEVMAYVNALQVPGEPYGCYRLKPNKEADFYATCDVAILRTVMGEELKRSLTADQRREWIDYINTYAEQDGVYRAERHAEQHRNGMAIGALGVLGGRQKYPVRFYQDFDKLEKVGPWLEKIDWRNQWGASHLFWGGMHCYSMSGECTDAWRNAMFEWLDANLDAETGWWRKGEQHADRYQPLGGGAHIWPVYQHHARRFPYPSQVIDSILDIQREDGSWLGFSNYMDLDALYGLAYMRSLAPDHRPDDVRKAVQKHGDLALMSYRGFMNRKPDTHQLLSAVGALGLLHQLAPDRFRDTAKWTDIFSDVRLYDTKSVECVPRGEEAR